MCYHMSWPMTIPNTPNLSKYVLYILYIYLSKLYGTSRYHSQSTGVPSMAQELYLYILYYIIYVNILYLFNALIDNHDCSKNRRNSRVFTKTFGFHPKLLSIAPHQDMKKGSHLAKIRYQRRSLLQLLKIASHSRFSRLAAPNHKLIRSDQGHGYSQIPCPPTKKNIAELYYIRTY